MRSHISATFSASPAGWSVPLADASLYQLYSPYSYRTLLDLDGDGRTDLVDCYDQDNGGAFEAGGQQSWRVWVGEP